MASFHTTSCCGIDCYHWVLSLRSFALFILHDSHPLIRPAHHDQSCYVSYLRFSTDFYGADCGLTSSSKILTHNINYNQWYWITTFQKQQKKLLKWWCVFFQKAGYWESFSTAFSQYIIHTILLSKFRYPARTFVTLRVSAYHLLISIQLLIQNDQSSIVCSHVRGPVRLYLNTSQCLVVNAEVSALILANWSIIFHGFNGEFPSFTHESQLTCYKFSASDKYISCFFGGVLSSLRK